MSNNTEINEWIKWIEESIAKKQIKYYDYKHFNNIQEIGRGSFGKVYRANWKKSHSYLALKSFINFNISAKEVVNEVITIYVYFCLYDIKVYMYITFLIYNFIYF
jgi:hypothetical protein